MDTQDYKILIVDDKPSNLHFLSKVLTERGYKVQRAISGQLALNGAIDAPPDLILLDIIMPQMNGYEVCQRLKAAPETCEIPVIFLSALHEALDKVKGFEVGGVDYITKPFQVEEVLARIEKQLTIQRLSKQLREQNQRLQQEIEVRKQTENTLRESEARFRGIFENAAIAIGLTDAQGRLIAVNPTFKDFLGYSEAEMCAPNFGNITHPDDQGIDATLTQDMIIGVRDSFQLEKRYIRKDGQIFWGRATVSAVRNQQGEFQFSVGMLEDINDVKIREFALKESERRFRAIFNHTFQFTGLLTPDGTLIEANQTVLDFGGIERDDVVGLPFWEARWWTISQETQRQLKDAIAAAVAGEFVRYEVEVLGAGDRVATIDFSLKPVWDEAGNVVLLIPEGRDITERKQAEEQIASRHRELLTLHRISEIHLSTRSLQETFQEIVEEVSAATGFPIVAIERYDASRQVMVFEGMKGIDLPTNTRVLEVPADQTLSGTVVRTGQPVIKAFAPEETKPCDADETLSQLTIKTFICMPMSIEKRVIGTLSLAHPDIVRFDNHLPQWLGSLANYVASLTERKRAEIELQAAKTALEQQIRRALLLNHITQEIRSSLNSQQIFQTAATQIGLAFGVSRCLIHAYIEAPVPHIPLVAEYTEPGLESILNVEIPVRGNPHAELMLAQDCAIASDDICADPRLEAALPLCQQLGLKSMLAVRTSYWGKPNGAIGLHQYDRVRHWTKDEIELIEAVAAQMGIAIAQANLLEQEKQRRRELNRQNQQLQAEIRIRKQAEEQLRASQQKLSFLVQNTPLAVIEWNINREVVSWNQAAAKIFGYSPEQVRGKQSLQFLVPECAKPHVQAIYEQLLTRQGGTHSINENLTKDGRTIICEWYNTPLIDDYGTVVGVASIAVDITERQQAKVALQQALEAAERANRAKSDFLASMSHELRTPLNAILGFSQILTYDGSLTPEQQDYLSIINRSGEHLLSLINDVLSMSKIEAGQVTLTETCFDLYGLLDSIEEMLRLKANSKGLQLTVERHTDIPQYVTTDESKLRQVLLNLLGNAIKFTQRGRVTLRVRRTENEKLRSNNQEHHQFPSGALLFSEGTSEARRSPSGGQRPTNQHHPIPNSQFPITFEVEDTGVGIASDELNTLFDPFIQTKIGRQSMEGTGLGLPISREFIHLMGGNISVRSVLGQGSTFTFDIKVSVATVANVEPNVSQQRVIGLEANQPKYRILIAEDVVENRMLLIKLLKPIGFEVREAINGQEAVAMWQSWQPDLILMDIQMPVMDGYEATRQIKQAAEAHATTIIAITASAFEEQREAILSAGCDDFIRKPLREQILWAKIGEHLGVRYIYEENSPLTSPHKSVQLSALTIEELKVMPDEWIQKLYQAGLSLDDQRIFELIDQIPENQAPLAKILTNLVNNFRLDIIVDLIQRNFFK